MRRIEFLLLSLALGPSSLLAQYIYTDHFTSINATDWTQNGTVSASSSGLTATSSTGGSLISTINLGVYGPASEYEMAATLTLTASGGTYISYLNASSNALAEGSSNTGSFYDIELQNPTFSGSACTATLAMNKYASGTFTTLASSVVACNNGMVIRAIHISANQFVIYVNDVWTLYVVDSTLTGGEPGVGARGTPSGNSIALGRVGAHDSTPPNAVDVSLVGTSSFSNRVDIQSPGTTDNTGGSGIEGYQIYRSAPGGGTPVYLSNPATANFSDTTVAAGTTYTYQIYAFDFDLNSTASATFNVTTPPSGGIDPRRVGVRPTGAYWGASPEQIDVLSGNLSYSLPLLKAQGRNGWGVGFSLSYNSQNWRKDSGGVWDLGRDVGFGYGWKLLAGSLTPYWSSYWTVDHWTFTDSTGAEYRLTNNSGGVWTSTESIYLSYDSNTGILHFPDGSFWTMGAVSGGLEQDAGTYYPTVMEDTNGNQVLLTYATGTGASWSNSSARITQIADVRAVNPGSGDYYTYAFTYNTDYPVPHLTGISNTIGTGESYSFYYYSPNTLYDPFVSDSYGTTTCFKEVTLVDGTNYTFDYDWSGTTPTSGNLTAVILPYRGWIDWAYSNATYLGSRTQQEVGERLLSKDGSTYTTYPIYHESGTIYLTTHGCTMIDDPGGLGEKYWAFPYIAANPTLVTTYQGRSPVGGTNCSTTPASTAMTQNNFTWTEDSAGNFYIGEVDTYADPGTSNAIEKKTTQTVDVHGNVTQVNNYNWGGSLARTYNYSYLSSGSYPSLYIFNRLTSATVTPYGGSTLTLASIGYDGSGLSTPGGSAPREWDSTYTSGVTARGNVTSSTDISGNSTAITYDIYGNTTGTTVNGVMSTASTSSTTNFAAPDSITVNSTLTTSMTYGSFLGLTSQTGPSGTSVDIGYDTTGRPTSSTSPYGATTYYVYNDSASPPNSCTSVNTRWTETSLDGLGRALKVLTGSYASSGQTSCSSASGAVTLSETDTTYGSCGCSPLGKMMSQTVPYTYGGSVGASTTYTYDGIGRALTVTSGGSDTSGETEYVYAGNTIKVTVLAATNVVKVFTMDAFGNLTQVVEDPGGLAYTTTYSYDVLNHLTGVSMTRSTGTQTRSFVYSGNQLTSATNPENGTVSYTYKTSGYGIGKVATRTDAKGQEVVYSYDPYSRLSEVQRYPTGISGGEDTCQREVYYYDGTTPSSSSRVTASLGHLSAVQYWGAYNPNTIPTCDTTFTETYTYATSGAPVSKGLSATRNLQWGGVGWFNYSLGLNATFSYDNEGRMTGETYPTDNSGTTVSVSYTFDSMGRLNTMTDNIASLTLIAGASYGPANELTGIAGGGYLGAWAGESRTYNSLKQLTGISAGPYTSPLSITYHYPSTGNNGKIDYQHDNISGEQVNYTYDALNRLITAATSSSDWGQSFTYDGFGNLTNVGVTKGSAPTMTASYDANNHTGSVDANGNPASIYLPADGSYYGAAYDVENRLVATGSSAIFYSYAPDNKRVWRGTWTGSYPNWTRGTDTITFYSVSGQKLGDYALTTISGTGYEPQFYATESEVNYYFGSKLIANGKGWVYSDRLSSVGKFYPYGQEISPTTNGTEKFTGYFRDSETGNDYADQRYMTPGTGRFLTPDRGTGGAKSTDPGSWNHYTYTRGDPVNRVDRHGTDDEDDDDGSDDGGDGFWNNGGGGGLNACFSFAGLFSAAGLGMDACQAAIDACSTGGDVTFVSDGPITPSIEAYLCGLAGVAGPQAAQGGANGGVAVATNYSTTSQQAIGVQNDLRWLEQAIMADPSCDAWLNTPAAPIADAVGIALGTIGDAGMAVGVANISDPTINATQGPVISGIPGNNQITISLNGAFFNSNVGVGSYYVNGNLTPLPYVGGTDGAQALILLHELAHLTGAANFNQTDYGSAQAEAYNNTLVMQNCVGVISRAQGIY